MKLFSNLFLSFLLFASSFVTFGSYKGDIFMDIAYRDGRGVSKKLRSGADITVLNDQGQTLLIKAVQAKNTGLVKKLLKRSINVDIVDDLGKTAMDYAAEGNYKGIILKLAKKHAKVTNQDNMITVRKVITSRYRLYKALGIIFFATTIVVPLFVIYSFTVYTVGGCYAQQFGGMQTLVYTKSSRCKHPELISLAVSLPCLLLSTIFTLKSISWSDRRDWYTPHLISYE